MPKKTCPIEINGAAPRLRASLEGKFLIATLFVILTSLLPLTVAFFLTIDTIKRQSIDLFNRESQALITAETAALAGGELLSSDLPLEENLTASNRDESLQIVLRQTEALSDFSNAISEYTEQSSFSREPRIRELLAAARREELIKGEESLLAAIAADLRRTEAGHQALAELINAGEFDQALVLCHETMLPLHENLSRNAATLASHISEVIARLTSAADALTGQLATSTLVILIFSIFLAVGISLVLVRHLTRPLRNIRDFADAIAHGNYAAKMPKLTHDEIGALGAALDHMRKRIESFIAELQESYQHEVEHLKEIADLKDQFAFIAAHELKTPVAAIRWNLDLIQESAAFKKLPPDLQESAQDVQSSAIRLNTLVNDLLHVSRLEKGTVKSSLQAVDPGRTVEETIKELSYLARDRGVTVSYRPPKETLRFRADPTLFREVVQNLVSNAIKYNRTKGRVLINAGAADSRGWIEIEDQGLGFTPAERKNVYQRFWRSERVGDIEGTGLGLYIVKQFVDMMKGTIDLKSRPGAGSAFRVTLPLAKK